MIITIALHSRKCITNLRLSVGQFLNWEFLNIEIEPENILGSFIMHAQCNCHSQFQGVNLRVPPDSPRINTEYKNSEWVLQVQSLIPKSLKDS